MRLFTAAVLMVRDMRLAQAAALAHAGEAVASAPARRHERRYPEQPDRLGDPKRCLVELAFVARLADDRKGLVEFLGCFHGGGTLARQAVSEHDRLDLKSGSDHMRGRPTGQDLRRRGERRRGEQFPRLLLKL